MRWLAQAMQQEWRGQQWHGGVTPLGMAQGWIRPYPMGLPQPWPLQLPLMVSRGPSQGDLQLLMYMDCSLVCANPLLHTPQVSPTSTPHKRQGATAVCGACFASLQCRSTSHLSSVNAKPFVAVKRHANHQQHAMAWMAFAARV